MSALLIVAELGASHSGGDLAHAIKTVQAAAETGANAVKFQTWTPGSMCIDPAAICHSGPWRGKPLQALYADAWLPWEWHKPLFEAARDAGVVPFSTPFDRESVDFLETLGCPMYKIASFELVDLPLIGYVARTAKPMVMSTGMATYSEIVDAVLSARGTPKITLLHCVSSYPTLPEDVNMARMLALQDTFGRPVGLSDHSTSLIVPALAAYLGATMIEKHFTLGGGLDAAFALEPPAFAQMVREVRMVGMAMGSAKFGPTVGEDPSLRRSLYWARNLEYNQKIKPGDLITARPAAGAPCHLLPTAIGKSLTRQVKRGEPAKVGDWA